MEELRLEEVPGALRVSQEAEAACPSLSSTPSCLSSHPRLGSQLPPAHQCSLPLPGETVETDQAPSWAAYVLRDARGFYALAVGTEKGVLRADGKMTHPWRRRAGLETGPAGPALGAPLGLGSPSWEHGVGAI